MITDEVPSLAGALRSQFLVAVHEDAGGDIVRNRSPRGHRTTPASPRLSLVTSARLKGEGRQRRQRRHEGKSKTTAARPTGPGLVIQAKWGRGQYRTGLPTVQAFRGRALQVRLQLQVCSRHTAGRHTPFLLGLKRQRSVSLRDSSERPCRSGRHPARASSGTRPPLRLLAP